MKSGKFVLAALSLTILLTACSDPVSPNPPNTGENPPSKSALHPAPPAPVGFGITYA